MNSAYPLVKLQKWSASDLDGQPILFDFMLEGRRIRGQGQLQVTEVRTGAYISILTYSKDSAATRCIELSQEEADMIKKAGKLAGFLCQCLPADLAAPNPPKLVPAA
ncbi:MAG TPA: hypothetical protein VMF06_14860 [Candidatus Limnocylindria bacterium]|jgi:hypothetical protein|nr:hypothetical protein [Candidatus Limnocylindria bacterium]